MIWDTPVSIQNPCMCMYIWIILRWLNVYMGKQCTLNKMIWLLVSKCDGKFYRYLAATGLADFSQPSQQISKNHIAVWFVSNKQWKLINEAGWYTMIPAHAKSTVAIRKYKDIAKNNSDTTKHPYKTMLWEFTVMIGSLDFVNIENPKRKHGSIPEPTQ